MKAGTRTFLITAGLFAVMSLGYIYVVVRVRSRHAPGPGVLNFRDLQHQGVPMTRAVRIATPPGHFCVFGEFAPLWTLPSGPPAYLFDPSGSLVDFTMDVGDSTRFQDDYGVYRGTTIELSELSRTFPPTGK